MIYFRWSAVNIIRNLAVNRRSRKLLNPNNTNERNIKNGLMPEVTINAVTTAPASIMIKNRNAILLKKFSAADSF